MAATLLAPTTNLNGAPEDFKLVQDYKRDADKRHKYALGVWHAVRDDGAPRPWKGSSRLDSRRCQHEEAKQPRLTRHAVHKNAGKHRVDLTPDARFDAACFDRGPLLDDSSAAEDVREPSPAPAPDAGITYSFDAPRGASRGGEVLSEAISQAVDRYERRETQKLVDREYDVVDKGEDEEHGGYVADEDDYELV